MGTVDMLEASRVFGVRRFVYISSGAVYGVRDDIPREDEPMTPGDLYGAAKASAEFFGLQYANEFGLDFRALRVYFAYGPGRYPSELYPLYRSVFGPLEGKNNDLAAGRGRPVGRFHLPERHRPRRLPVLGGRPFKAPPVQCVQRGLPPDPGAHPQGGGRLRRWTSKSRSDPAASCPEDPAWTVPALGKSSGLLPNTISIAASTSTPNGCRRNDIHEDYLIPNPLRSAGALRMDNPFSARHAEDLLFSLPYGAKDEAPSRALAGRPCRHRAGNRRQTVISRRGTCRCEGPGHRGALGVRGRTAHRGCRRSRRPRLPSRIHSAFRPISPFSKPASLKQADLVPARASAPAGAAVIRSLKLAAELARKDRIDAICYAPLNKQAMHMAGIPLSGRVEVFCA